MDCSPPGSSVEKAMAPHSSTLAWKIPWMEEPGRLQSMGSQRVRHDWTTWLSLFTFMHWKGNGNPLQCSYLENPRDGGAWWAAVYGVAQSWTRLKLLSSSSSRLLCPWNSLGKNTKVGCYSLLLQGICQTPGSNPGLLNGACMCAKSLQSCQTLCDPMDYSPAGSSVHGILQARILEWVAKALL